MSEHNYAALAFKHEREKNPALMDFSNLDSQIAKVIKDRQALDAKNAEARSTLPELRKEYNQLRQKLFDLKQDVRCYEQRCNDAAGTIRLLEQRINDGLKQKKAAAEASNFRGERSFEHQVTLLEANLTDAQEDFNKNKAWSGQAARTLKAFDGHARIAELKTILDAPLPVVKSDNVPK